MLLVDSSVWIDHVRNLDTDAIRFVELRDEDEEIAMAGVIFQEVLQGARDDAVYDRLRDMFSGLLLLEPRDLSTYEVAAQLHRRARRAGFTMRKPTDCLIAALALEHGAMLVHNDRDFVFLAQVEPALIVYPGRPH
ncbi:type II toxin-antitoxin system VapC family toxin [Ramlibacter montanisoli]|uniref:Ribonuclease VapC n=1 Tax=Ramlibacter montanisoli TaxID=2732512 RepID=A0A849KI48_9BURK|nr:PIN domain nuclease [Ramlibacter montanisoli]NNU44271.1 PIN domain nuclease [Ramlibacter montanisoli]